jgi:hypothetical protein
MSSGPAGPRPAEVFRTFVSELAAFRQAPDMVDRLRQGHQPDRHGWCSHSAHAHRWERYPCAMVRLATLVENVEGHARPEYTDKDAENPSPEAGRT